MVFGVTAGGGGAELGFLSPVNEDLNPRRTVLARTLVDGGAESEKCPGERSRCDQRPNRLPWGGKEVRTVRNAYGPAHFLHRKPLCSHWRVNSDRQRKRSREPGWQLKSNENAGATGVPPKTGESRPGANYKMPRVRF